MGYGGLFGRARYQPVTAFAPELAEGGDMQFANGPAATVAAKPVAARPGLFARAGNWLRTRDWERIGAAMRDDPAILQNLMAERRQAASDARQAAEAEAQRRSLKQQNTDREAYIATLPQDQQLALRAGVQPQTPDWQVDDFGRPYTLTPQGQVQYGQGRVQMRAPGAAADRAPPAGYRYTADGSLEAIPGGPADIRQTAEGRQSAGRLDSSLNQIDTALSAIDESEGILNQSAATDWNPLNDATGMTGGLMRNVPGSRAYDFNQALEPVRAILSFETLAEMRRNSQTGGALGSIAVRELELLGRVVRSLDTAQSPQQVRRNLAAVRAQLTRTRQAVAAARSEMNGAGQPQQQGGQQPRVIELDP